MSTHIDELRQSFKDLLAQAKKYGTDDPETAYRVVRATANLCDEVMQLEEEDRLYVFNCEELTELSRLYPWQKIEAVITYMNEKGYGHKNE